MARRSRAARIRAAAGTALFLVIGPGTVVGLVPWLITGWQPGHRELAASLAGGVLAAAGCGVLLYAFGQFAIGGLGTPAPTAPTEQLVTRGLYRYVRNPMYLAVLAGIAGQALLLDRPVLLVYAAGVGSAFLAFVHWYEAGPDPPLRQPVPGLPPPGSGLAAMRAGTSRVARSPRAGLAEREVCMRWSP